MFVIQVLSANHSQQIKRKNVLSQFLSSQQQDTESNDFHKWFFS